MLIEDYPYWLCDIWGVLHAGGHLHEKALGALARHRSHGGKVVLISNAPQPSSVVAAQLTTKGLSSQMYDGIVTSGDVTARLAAQFAPGQYFLIGPADYDAALLDRLPNAQAQQAEAARFILCTGPDDWDAQDVRVYSNRFADYIRLGLPMLCANPDRVVQADGRLILCAGSLADLYAQMGGQVIMAGKPAPTIYRDGLKLLGCVSPDQVLAIGDGIATDGVGAAQAGIDFAFVLSGIHAGEFADEGAVRAHLSRSLPGLKLLHVLAELA